MDEQASVSESQVVSPWRGLGRIVVILVVLGFVALLVYGLLSKGTSDRIDTGLDQGKPVPTPAFDLALLQEGELPPKLKRKLGPKMADGRLSTNDLRGTPYVLNMWASWCTPCREEAKPLEAGWRIAGRTGVLFLGLNIQDITGDARAFLDEFDTTYPSVREPDKDVASEFGATGIPETFFIDARGFAVGHVIGAIKPEQLGRGVAAAASGRVVGVGSGGKSFKTR